MQRGGWDGRGRGDGVWRLGGGAEKTRGLGEEAEGVHEGV